MTPLITNKEMTKQLETRLGILQDGKQLMELSLIDKLHQIKKTVNKLSEALLCNKYGYNSNANILGRKANQW